MKYDAQLVEVAKLLPEIKSVLVALPASPDVDELAAGLAFFLSLEQGGKEAAIVTEGTIRVGHTNLFGVGEIQSKVPETRGGDYVITLGGVAGVGPDGKGTVPSLEKLDYYTSGNDLNLVFKVLSGQKFEPAFVTPRYEGGNLDLVFVLGAAALADLGGLYSANPELFAKAHLVNIDNSQGNAQFGKTNVVDPEASSVSEMVSQVISSLGLSVNGDIATNILSGIFSATSDLQQRNTGADTYEVVAQALRVGGQRPSITQPVPSASGPVPTAAPVQAAEQTTTPAGFDLSKVFGAPINSAPDNFTTSPAAVSTHPEAEPEPQPSPEEAVVGEEVVTPEEDWLTPKILHGKNTLG